LVFSDEIEAEDHDVTKNELSDSYSSVEENKSFGLFHKDGRGSGKISSSANNSHTAQVLSLVNHGRGELAECVESEGLTKSSNNCKEQSNCE